MSILAPAAPALAARPPGPRFATGNQVIAPAGRAVVVHVWFGRLDAGRRETTLVGVRYDGDGNPWSPVVWYEERDVASVHA